jgi:hypothetical protein
VVSRKPRARSIRRIAVNATTHVGVEERSATVIGAITVVALIFWNYGSVSVYAIEYARLVRVIFLGRCITGSESTCY